MNHSGKYLPLGLMMAGSLFAATQAWALPLGDSFYNVGTDGDPRMRQIADAQATSERTIYKSTQKEQQNFQGFFIPASNTTKLAVLSDDGVTVDIDNVITNVQNAGKGQHGSSLAESLHIINYTFKEGQVYRINIEYTNTQYNDDKDLDGMTLFAYGGGGRVQEVNLIISSGLNSSAASEDDEETVGAFTVANINDTDGDGVIDNIDDNVVGTARGRNEVDLMALDITRPAGPTTDKLSVRILSGQAKLWQTATKGTPVPLVNGAAQFALSDLPKRIWLEATTTSNALRDIAVELDYKGQKDTVRATGAWAQMSAAAYSTRSAADLFAVPVWQDTTTPPRPRVEELDGVGLRPINRVNNVANVILMQFTLSPAGVENQPFVHFDVSRQAEGKIWIRRGANPFEEYREAHHDFPTRDESANDDSHNDDESAAPSQSRMYVVDSPGWASAYADIDEKELAFKATFLEFVRLGIGTQRPEGNGEIGSRCSGKYNWHCRHRLIASPIDGGWIRREGTDNNDIGTGRIVVGDTP